MLPPFFLPVKRQEGWKRVVSLKGDSLFDLQTHGSLFDADGARTRSALIKNGGTSYPSWLPSSFTCFFILPY
jgi:hypothetical protein